MGTSSSYSGPTGTIPLLPRWPEDRLTPAPPDSNTPSVSGEPFGSDIQMSLISWRVPKTILSRLANGVGVGLGVGALASLSHSYVEASGGTRVVASSARAGRASSARLGGFLADGVQNGFQQAARNIGLEPFLGHDVEYVLTAFIDMIAPDGALREEAVARVAIIETCTELFDQYDVANDGIEALDRMDADGIRAVVALSITNYVNVRLQEELVNRIERSTLNEEDANALMLEIKDFIASVVQLDLSEIDVLALDWNGPEGYRVVERIYETGYEMLGGTE